MTHYLLPDPILDFWFSEQVEPLRFRSTPEFDNEIYQRFLGAWCTARDNELKGWLGTARGCLALVIILDQFPLHMFRGQAKSFSTEQKACEVADHAISAGLDNELTDEERAFLYLPFMHSESLSDQNRAVALYEAVGLASNLHWAKHHRELIQRFGRFPHRNAILGRESTPEEIEYLESKKGFLG